MKNLINRKFKISKSQKGFTIIEILIVLPLVAILSLVISSTVFDQYGQLLQGSARARLRVEGETTLLSLEDELLFTTNFASVKSNDLTDANAPVGGWTSNTTPTDTLIIYETALDSDRRDPDREFIYKKSGACSSSYNIALNNLVYFTTQNTADQYRTLYRRTIVPSYETCGVNFKNQTCPASSVTSPCQGADALLSTKVVDFQLEYFDENNIAVTNPFDAELIKLRLTLGEKIYGKNIQVTSTISMKKIN
jgi:prepilin-type N-terminal cleavage/methylation domain-containing protein